jgi:uncharacterized protein (DUF2062 family)
MAPRKGWRRGYLYLGKRVQRLPDSPHRIALGFACGVMASFTPFFGFHFVIAAALAFITRGNILASAIGTFVGNPLTFPFIAGTAMYLGHRITGIGLEFQNHIFTFGSLWDNLEAIFVPYLVGGFFPGVAASVTAYWLGRPVVAAFQKRRRSKLMKRAKQRLHLREKAAARAKPAADLAQ